MKIKLSQKQWELIGSKAGWLKSAQFQWLLSDEKQKILLKIFKSLPGNLQKADTIANYSIEEKDEALGDRYIQTSFSSDKNAFIVDRYFENEVQQDMYGKTIQIPVNWENPQETINLIIKQIEQLRKD